MKIYTKKEEEYARGKRLSPGVPGTGVLRAGTRDHIQPPSDVAHAAGCRYCAILKKWEDRDFRKKGADWLAKNGEEQCRRPTGGGGPPGGGTRHAH